VAGKHLSHIFLPPFSCQLVAVCLVSYTVLVVPKIVNSFTESATNGSGPVLSERQLEFGWRPCRPVFAAGQPLQAGDEADFYKGNYAPDGDYILSGGLIKDLPPPIEVPVHYEAPGFDGSRLSKVPAPGVHPRVIISPLDIQRFKQMHAMGDKAPRIFRLQMEQMRRDREWQIPAQHNYSGSPWGEDSKIAGWALYALITDDQVLGRQAAEATVRHARYVEPWAEIVNSAPKTAPIKDVAYDFVRMGLFFGSVDYKTAYYQGGRQRVETLYHEHGVTLGANSPAPGCLTLGWEYDYAYNFMTDEERNIVRRVISKITYGKYTTGMALPGQMFINNHMSGSANQICLALAIEGEEGYDPRIAKMAEWSLTNKLSYDLSSDGITYENTKGFIPMLPVLAIARRQGADHPQNLLKHSHLLARANSNVQHARKLYYRYFADSRRRPDSKPLDQIITGLDEERYWRASGGSGSGGHLEFWSTLKHFYPSDGLVDFVWNCKLPGSLSYYEGKPDDNWNGKIHDAWFQLKAINLLTAAHMTDYNKLDTLEQFEGIEKFWFDSERGMVSARNDWTQDSMLVHMENRTDQYYMGHESPQHGDFQVWADGIPWVNNGGAYLDCSFRNMVLVDGLAGVYAPVSGDWMTASNTPQAATSVAEMTTAYQWRKSMNGLRHLDHPGLEQMPSQMGRFASDAYTLNRFTELPYLPKIREHYDGFAHLDYGPWHGETRGPERYIKWNDPMDHVFRTIHFARGVKPYLLVMDDLRKADDEDHQFDWRMMITGDAVVYDSNPAVQGRHLEKNTEGVVGTDLLFCMADDNYRRGQGNAWGLRYVQMQPNPEKGDPMLLVRVLWRNSNFPYPVPNVQRSFSWNMVSVPAFGKSPEYRVMVFPHRYGDKLPVTEWSDDRSRLTVKVGGNIDVYDFDQTDRQRTVFSMSRNGRKLTDSAARPPKPILVERTKFTIDRNRPDWRPPRLLHEPIQVRFAPCKPGAQIHYSLDGSDPGPDSPTYNGHIPVDRTCTLKARTCQADWRFGKNNWSETATFEFKKQSPVVPASASESASGLLVQGYEIKTTLFDKKGFFQGSKNSLPDIAVHKPLVTTSVPGFDIPVMESREPRKRMMKAFYQFQGYFDATETGVYSFEVESCGPVDLNVAGQSIILVNQQYGLSYKRRYGEMALAKGRHKLNLVVCDPVFWKGDMEEPYAIGVSVMAPSSDAYTPIDPAQLSRFCSLTSPSLREGRGASPSEPTRGGLNHEVEVNRSAAPPRSLVPRLRPSLREGEMRKTRHLHPAVEVDVVPGLIERKYDRIDFLTTDAAVNPNDKSEAKLIPVDGFPPAYFDVKTAEPYSTAIVDLMSANNSPRKLVEYQGYIRTARDGVYEFKLKQGRENAARLLIDGHVVVRQQVDAPKTDGFIRLAGGLHRFKLQLAMGKALVSVKHADDDVFQTVGPSALARSVAFKLPESEQTDRMAIPTNGLIAHLTCESIDDGKTPVLSGKGAVAIVEGGEVIEDGVRGKALGMYGPAARIILRGLRQREDECTISTWVKFKDRTQDIGIWSRIDNTWPEHMSFRLRGNRLCAEWQRGIGIADTRVDNMVVEPGKWLHIAATFGKENAVYFNGELVDSAHAKNFSKRRANGFVDNGQAMTCRNQPTAVDEYRIYDRALSPAEIKAIYESEFGEAKDGSVSKTLPPA
jgi:hypothetical protein